MRKIDLEGKRFGSLTVVRPEQAWLCVCDCGRTKVTLGKYLRNGDVQGCGSCGAKVRADKRKTHGLSQTRAYRAWTAAKVRCYNPNFIYYANYGGRGVKMCDHWKESFEAFYADMGECPPNRSLDRIDVNGDYEPNNCRWADNQTQASNRTNARLLTYFDQTRTATEWVYFLNTTHKVLYKRIKRFGVEEGVMRIVLERLAGLPGPSVGKSAAKEEKQRRAA